MIVPVCKNKEHLCDAGFCAAGQLCLAEAEATLLARIHLVVFRTLSNG